MKLLIITTIARNNVNNSILPKLYTKIETTKTILITENKNIDDDNQKSNDSESINKITISNHNAHHKSHNHKHHNNVRTVSMHDETQR